MNPTIRYLVLVCLLAGGLLVACGTGPDGSIPDGYARVSFLLKSDTGKCGDRGCSGIAEGVAQAWVKIDEVSVHAAGGGWSVVSQNVTLVDLLRLPEHAAELGIADLPAGKITQIRLHVAEDSDSHVVLDDDSQVPMVVPSGDKSGIKVKGPWDLAECTENLVGLVISNHHNAIHVHPNGHGDLYIFRPVIKADELITEEGDCDDPDEGDDDPDEGDDDPPDGDDDPPNDEDDPPNDDDDPPPDDDCDPAIDDTCVQP